MRIPREEVYWLPIARKLLLRKAGQQLPLTSVSLSVLLYICAKWTHVDGVLASLYRWSEDYAEEEHALSVWSSLTKPFSRLFTHSFVRQGVALDSHRTGGFSAITRGLQMCKLPIDAAHYSFPICGTGLLGLWYTQEGL